MQDIATSLLQWEVIHCPPEKATLHPACRVRSPLAFQAAPGGGGAPCIGAHSTHTPGLLGMEVPALPQSPHTASSRSFLGNLPDLSPWMVEVASEAG
jgi:hypothetical protein